MTDYVPRKSDIDTKRGRVCIAFLNDAYDETRVDEKFRVPDERLLEKHFDLEEQAEQSAPLHQEWSGVFGGMRDAMNMMCILTYKKARHFSHCELCFFCSPSGVSRYGGEYMISCSVREDGGVCISARKFNRRYTWLYLEVSEFETKCIVDFIFMHLNKRYDHNATKRLFSIPRATTGRMWYCSELTMCALQLLPCPSLHSMRANCVEVDDIYLLARQSSRLSNSALEIAPFQIYNAYKKTKKNEHYDIVDDLGI